MFEGLVGQGQATAAQSAHIPFTPSAKRTLELSLSEAQLLSHDYIGTEHLLLGLLGLGEGPAYEVLTAHGVDLETARAEVTRLPHEHEAR
ncbi:MAG TPA: Clp protease N-terminal domain-containing protein [Streptosporangiaceae bacterium]|jgi:ATP-dependent Clp protease ATP-binding subunit ClpC